MYHPTLPLVQEIRPFIQGAALFAPLDTTFYTGSVHVAASFEDGVLVLRPFGLDNPDLRLVRFLDGEELVWIIQGTESRMHRID